MSETKSERCATSARCRQPLAFVVTTGSWSSVVCAKHLGLLCGRLLPASTEGRLVVTAR